jgi:hypothetical protein
LYSALSRTSQAVARLRDRDALFAEVCTIAAELGHLSATWIGLIDAGGEHLVPAASSGAGAQYARSIEVPLDPQRPAGNGPIAVALRETASTCATTWTPIRGRCPGAVWRRGSAFAR